MSNNLLKSLMDHSTLNF